MALAYKYSVVFVCVFVVHLFHVYNSRVTAESRESIKDIFDMKEHFTPGHYIDDE